MKNRPKNPFLLLAAISLVTIFSSFAVKKNWPANHKTTSKTVERNNEGKTVIKTQILLDRTTSREDLIAACSLLSKENVQLTFDLLQIRKSFLGVLGNSRIAYAKGQIQLPDGSVERFRAGGPFNFKFIRIIYFQDSQTNQYKISMVETVD
jgi:hypothetical protein